MLRKAQKNFYFFCNISDLPIVYRAERQKHANNERKIFYEKDDFYDDGTGSSRYDGSTGDGGK